MGHRAAMAIEPSADVLERIQDANDRDYAINNLELDSIRLREVQTALGRLDAGTFGTCSGFQACMAPARFLLRTEITICV